MTPLDKERKKTSNITRSMYEKQHNIYLKNKVLFDRFLKMYSDISYYHFKEGELNGDKILDAGCGNTAYFQVVMHRFGVKYQNCLDLVNNWINILKEKLTEYEVPLNNIKFVPGSTDDLPFADQEFDFVASNGILVHLNDVAQAK